jgi:hypothetical protein
MTYTPPRTHAEILAKEYLLIEDVAELLSVTVESVRTKIQTGSVPQPKPRGRRIYWKTSVFVSWMDGSGDGDEPWTPPHRTPPRGTPPVARRRQPR